MQSPIDSVFVESEWITNTEWVCTFSDDGCPADECTCTPSLMELTIRAVWVVWRKVVERSNAYGLVVVAPNQVN